MKPRMHDAESPPRRWCCFALSLLLVLVGCAPVTPTGPETSRSVGAPGLRRNRTDTPAISTNHVVERLLTRSRRQLRRGQLRSAESTLDRVLSLRPSVPHAWHLLARIRKRQNRLRQAEYLARKSLQFSGENEREQNIKNWKLIGRIRYLQNDPEGHARARERINQLRDG